jgi:hypothetical protein
MSETNALAYFAKPSVTEKKSFITTKQGRLRRGPEAKRLRRLPVGRQAVLQTKAERTGQSLTLQPSLKGHLQWRDSPQQQHYEALSFSK